MNNEMIWIGLTALGLGMIVMKLFLIRKEKVTTRDYEAKLLQKENERAELDRLYHSLKASVQAKDEAQAMLIQDKEQRLINLEREKKVLQEELSQLKMREAQLEEKRLALESKIEEQKNFLEKSQDAMKTQFESMSQKILEEKKEAFEKSSKKDLENLISPLQANIKDFKEKVEKVYDFEARERHSLKDKIEELAKSTLIVNQEAQNLTKAIKGDRKLQGNWGEMQLTMILENSGLQEGREYITQGKGMEIKDEDGKRRMPDVIVKLPQGNVVIDSKVSLSAYERFINSEDESERVVHIKDFLGAINKHISDLSDKKYHDLVGIDTVEYTMMFVPIEGALMFALESDPQIFAKALEKKVMLVGPTMLYPSLKTFANIWDTERRNKNAEEIARVAGSIYDKVVGFLDDMDKIKKGITALDSHYDSAVKKLSTGKGNVLGTVEKMKKLGAKSNKEIPEKFEFSE